MNYVISLAVGFGVGLLYFMLRVNSPAPPLIALCGLLGMVAGEHAIPMVKSYLSPAASQGSNVSSSHVPGWVPAKALHESRESLAAVQSQRTSTHEE
jgi:XapX domain-containing protein